APLLNLGAVAVAGAADVEALAAEGDGDAAAATAAAAAAVAWPAPRDGEVGARLRAAPGAAAVGRLLVDVVAPLPRRLVDAAALHVPDGEAVIGEAACRRQLIARLQVVDLEHVGEDPLVRVVEREGVEHRLPPGAGVGGDDAPVVADAGRRVAVAAEVGAD